MKIKAGYILRDVAGTHVVVSVGKVDFDGMIKLNDTGVFLWKKLMENVSFDDLVSAMLSEYSVDRATAEKDTEAFLSRLRNAGLLDE